MAIVSRKIGSTSQLLDVFIPDATVSTGAGRANIIASTVTLSWYRADQAAVSSWTLTTGTLGTWAASTFTQANSSVALGMYQFSAPDGMFASGTHATALISGPAGTAAPVPIVVDLTSYALPVGVSSFALPVGVSSFATAVGVSSFALPVGISSFALPVGVSSFAINVGVSSTTAGERNSLADAYLNRDMSTGTDSGSTTVRTPRQALRAIRNKWDTATSTGWLQVYKEDDSTLSWSSALTGSSGANPIVTSDPEG